MLLQRIERYLQAHKMAPTRFGRDALADPCLVFDLRAGRELRAATARRICAYLDAADQRAPGERAS